MPVEVLLRMSYIDLDQRFSAEAGSSGGSPPWSTGICQTTRGFALAYGYGKLDRFDLTGATHFFQSETSAATLTSLILHQV